MCELLGMSASVPTDICFSFAGLIQRGGRTGPHKDGWGIVFYDGKGCRAFHDPQPSAQSQIAEFLSTYSIKSDIVISHIRRANRGRVALENTHRSCARCGVGTGPSPITGSSWASRNSRSPPFIQSAPRQRARLLLDAG